MKGLTKAANSDALIPNFINLIGSNEGFDESDKFLMSEALNKNF
jgi:hypothetical protein